jgi:pyruvate dehydrogenase E1 component alpha subunit
MLVASTTSAISPLRDNRDPKSGRISIPTVQYSADAPFRDGKRLRSTIPTLLANDPKLKPDELRHLFKTMLLTRAMDAKGMLLQRQGRIGFYLLATGHEASHIGSAYALKPTDWVIPYYRQPGIPLLRSKEPSVVLQSMINQWFANDRDATRGRQMPVHYSFKDQNFVSISSVIGTQLSHAVGIALAMRSKNKSGVAMTYIGDGGTSANDFHAALNIAAVRKAPVVFICENNGWGISVPIERQTASSTIAEKALAYGMPGIRVDGNNILEVYAVCAAAVARARAGNGPTLIETVTYRVKEHTSSDGGAYRNEDPREKQLIQAWENHDPINLFEKLLLARKVVKRTDREEFVRHAVALIDSAVREAETRPAPPVESLFVDVYSAMPPHLSEQLQSTQGGGSGRVNKDERFPL